MNFYLFFFSCLLHNFKNLHEKTLKYMIVAMAFIVKQGKVSSTRQCSYVVWVCLSFQSPAFLRCQVIK